MMDKEHVAAAIERFIEEVRTEQRVHEMRADDCRMQAQELSKMRAAVMEDQYDERKLREVYREVTKIIVMGEGE
jgi:hypothetical protein